jgi:hypothetical protein
MNDNLFDKKWTFLDTIKILLLIVTAFSTWNIISILTPDSPLAFIREIAAVGMVEGAFLGFEYATQKAKSKAQVRKATTGFFCSLAVIGFFAAVSGLLEFGGSALLSQSVGEWLNISWTVSGLVQAAALAVLVLWIVVLAAIYRLYSLDDPDQIINLTKIDLNGQVAVEANEALRLALEIAKPVIASARAKASVKQSYSGELNSDQINQLANDVEATLSAHYGAPMSVKETVFERKEAETPTVGDPFRGDEG